ncbi:MAG: molybdenum cofactor guanylyltransferase [Desulfobacterales bacterium]|nr:molybdenum cofactor guanylyltransferase [Desulfobacterales bacterium]
MTHPLTGVILAGGLNKRFNGLNKAFIQVDGVRILDRIYGIFHELFDEIILVTNEPNLYLEWDLNIVTDLFQVRSSLTGIHAGLFYATHPFAFFTACDTPFLKKEMVETVVESIVPHVDIVIPETSLGREPLCAAYSKRCLESIEGRLSRRVFKIQGFFRKMKVKKIHEKRLRAVDPGLKSFFNINTPEDLAHIPGWDE